MTGPSTTAAVADPASAPATPPPVQRLFTATLVIGVPGSGKTSLFDQFSVYLWETYRKVLLLYSWDGGAIPTYVQRRMKQGLIRFWRARTRSAEGLGIETLYLATKGYWPRQINPETGETSPAVPMVAPVSTKYTAWCPAGHELQTVPAMSLIGPTFCGQCKQMIPHGQLQVKEIVQRTRGFEQVGGVAFDGLTSMTGVVMEHMDHARGAGHIGGEKPAFGGVVLSGSVKLGGNNRADVGFGQSRAQQFVNNTLSIPYLVEGPVFTALAMEATDEGGLSIVGAKLPGRAATDEASAWFGNVCEMGKTIDDAGKSHFTLFLRPFTDAQGRRHLLKTSASPSGLPATLVDPPEDAMQPFTAANLGNVFRMLDDDLRRAMAEVIAGVPGTPAGLMAYGEAAEVELPAAGSVAPGNASGIPALTPPAPIGPGAPPPAAPPTVAPSAGVPVMAPKPRRGRAAPPTLPVAQAPAPAQAPLPTAMPIAAQAPMTIPMPGAALPTGTAPPPPPGAKPPQRAPGT